jgi:hypothetical protein
MRRLDMAENFEHIAVEQMEIMERLVHLTKELISELSQYRRMDAEEKLLEEIVEKTGGV